MGPEYDLTTSVTRRIIGLPATVNERPRQAKEERPMRTKVLALIVAALLALATLAPALATPSPPTGAGNGGGQSGQCTGPAADRPAVCPGS